MPDHAYSLIVEVWSQNMGSKIILGEKVCGSAKVFSSKKLAQNILWKRTLIPKKLIKDYLGSKEFR